jgi:hypothetical protein
MYASRMLNCNGVWHMVRELGSRRRAHRSQRDVLRDLASQRRGVAAPPRSFCHDTLPWSSLLRILKRRGFGRSVQQSNRRCSWRRSYGTRGGTRCARVHRAILFNPPQLYAIR